MSASGRSQPAEQRQPWVEISYSALVDKCRWRDPAPWRMADLSLCPARWVKYPSFAGQRGRSKRREHCALAASTSPAHRRQGEQGQGTPAPAKKNTTQAPRLIDNLHRNWKAKRAIMAPTQGGKAWRPWGGVTASCAAPTVGQNQIGDILLVTVRDNNIDQALKFLKKKMQREGIFREMKLRSAYEKPSERKVREKAEAIRRARKLARKTAIRDGLIAAPKPKTPAPGQRTPAFAQR